MIWQKVYSISFVKSAILCVIRYILLCICTLYILEILRNVCLGICISIIVHIYIYHIIQNILYMCVCFFQNILYKIFITLYIYVIIEPTICYLGKTHKKIQEAKDVCDIMVSYTEKYKVNMFGIFVIYYFDLYIYIL